ncbi:DUF1657 domain-containing protein, partial [Clostridium tertium]
MPTGTKLETALASAKGLAADMKTFSLDTDNEQAKQMFNQLASTMDGVEQSLQSRLDFVKQQEPQYNKSVSYTHLTLPTIF